MFDKVINACSYLLNNFPEASICRDYLDSRISKSSQDIFQFGYFPNENNINVLIDLVGKDLLKEIELLKIKTYENEFYPDANKYEVIPYFKDHQLIMPFKNQYGKTYGIVGRSLTPDKDRLKIIPKYKNTQESKLFKKGNLLFGLYENKKNIIEQNSVFIVEGQFDVIKAYESGFRNVVALGNCNMTAYQFSVITRYTDNIFLLLDNDEAGGKGRRRILNKYGKLANIRNFYLPEQYKDVDEYLSNNSYESMSLSIKD